MPDIDTQTLEQLADMYIDARVREPALAFLRSRYVAAGIDDPDLTEFEQMPIQQLLAYLDR